MRSFLTYKNGKDKLRYFFEKGGEKHENDFDGAGCHGMCDDWNNKHGIGHWQTIFGRTQIRGVAMGAVSELGTISLTDVFLVPIIMLCAIAGTTGIIWLIRRFSFKKDAEKNTERSKENEQSNPKY